LCDQEGGLTVFNFLSCRLNGGESGILTWRFLYSFCLEQDTVKTLINQGANRFTIGRNFNHQNLCGTDFRPFTDTIDTKKLLISTRVMSIHNTKTAFRAVSKSLQDLLDEDLMAAWNGATAEYEDLYRGGPN
jgi:hypothetical protein